MAKYRIRVGINRFEEFDIEAENLPNAQDEAIQQIMKLIESNPGYDFMIDDVTFLND